MPSAYTTWVELLESRGALHPEELLYRFLIDGDVDGDVQTIHYGQFLARVKAIATTLQAQGCAGERALLLYPPGIDFIEGFFGCLFAGVIAVPAYPPDPSRLARTLPRLRGIVADAQPRFVLTTAFVASFAEMLMPQAPELAALSWLSTDELDPSAGEGWARPDITEETLAFLQYTSGSTGRPKGVMLTHKNLMYNVRISSQRLGLGQPGDHMVSWLPQYHDMGLIGASINPVFNGYGATILSPMSFLQRPVRWVQAISAFRGTVSAAPNFAYDLVARKIKDEELAALDLSSWRVAVNGAEPVRAEVGERFLARFGPAGFAPTTYTPSYGMAESTLFISSKTTAEVVGTLSVDEAGLRRGEAQPAERDAPGSQRLVSCGKAVDPQEIAVVSLETLTEQPPLRVGEIWLRGQSDAIGYWRREEETKHTFGATLPGRGDGTWLRTGDLGFLDKDGELYVTGRAKDLIIVRGANHYPQDIEATVEGCDPAMRPACSAAFTLDVHGEERLIVAAEADPRLLGKGGASTLDELVNVVRAAVAEHHGVQPYAVTLLESRSIPKTTSGKIQRHAAKMEYLDGSAKVLGAWTQAAAAEEESAAPEAEQKTPRQIADWLTRAVASMVGVRARDLDPTAPFTQHGLDSLQAVELVGQLEAYLGVSVPTSAIWDHPNILKLAAHYGAGAEGGAATAEATASAEPIAVVGLGCRLPGAADPEAFWAALQAGKDAITAPPSGRWATRLGGFIPGVEDFDPEHFGLSPREARGMDPQQRLLLEVTFEALESAGISPERLAGSDTGVFIGISSSDYALISLADPERADAYSGTGNAHSIAANRLSYLLDLRGPSVAVDTACSSSLVALHLACQALRAGEIRCAIVGGVNLLLSPQATNAFARANMLAADGRCKTFDAAADGYVRGEGCGVVVLERVSTAQERGDRIHALVLGTAVNQDGRSNGLTAPNGVAQQRVIRAALANAGASPDQVVYVEAHGTGTPLGDPIELGALRAALGERATPCAVGSVKTNIGHLEAAAGVASLIKVVLSLQHGEIPGQLHFKRLNPAIELGALEIADRARPFPEGGLAGVSSFGFGGTNAHAVLSAAPTTTAAAPAPGRAVSLLTLSARSPELLQRLATAVAARLRAEPDAVADLCYSLNAGRARLRHRLAALGRDAAELAERLDDLQRRSPRLVLAEAPPRAPKVAFVFTGQGAQYVGMGRGLYAAEPVFREMIDRCDALLGKLPGGTLRELMFPEVEDAEASARLNNTTVTQPALFSLQVALAALWRAWGVRPDVVTGHSVGAYAAAVVAGALSVEDGLRLVAARGRLMGALPEGGAMAAVRGGEAEVSAALARAGSTIELAALNGPEETVISGARGALQQAIEALKAEGLRATELSVSHAFHSALMDPMLLEFTQVVSGLKFMEPEAVFVSDHSGEALGLDRLKDPLYWREHLRRAVRFTSALETLGALEPQLIVEIGPQPVLLGMGKRALPELDAAWLPSLRKGRDEVETLLLAVAEASARGVAVDWEAFEGDRPRRRLPAPTSPTNRRRMWVEEAPRGEQVTALQTVWRPAERLTGDLSGDWIVLGDAALIAEALAQAGGNIVPEQTLACRGVIDLRALGGGDAEALLGSTVTEVQALLARPALPLFFVTRLAQAVTPTDLVSPDQTSIWGLLRGLASEHPDRLGGLIDLDAEADPALALAELAAADGEQVAWRGGRRHVARLNETRGSATPAKIDADGWVLITGGLGGLGRQVAQWLFVQGARRLALLGRGAPSVEAAEAIEALRQGGAEVKVFAADVADETALGEVLAQLPNLRGVVHAAGVVERLPFDRLDAEALHRALRAKVAGARALDHLTRDAELDLFWMFSSVSALWGGQGLAAYAAANAFEDGLAARRVTSGRPALSLNWGVWAETGMASEAELSELARMGVRGLRSVDALDRLRRLGGAQGQRGVADVDWSRLRPVLDARRPSPLLSELGEASAAAVSSNTDAASAGGGELALRLQAAPPDTRRALLIEALRGLVRAVAAMSPDAPVAVDQGFFEMGLDSLMAVELQGRLGLALGRRVPATLLMDQPTLSRLADWLMTELAFDAAVVTVSSVGRSDEPIAIVGMACRLPGADSPAALWRLLTEGHDATREVPGDRWDIDAWHDPSGERPGSMIARRGGFIDGVDQFDASFFGVTGREASRMDPQHRLLLEVSWRALEDAGAVPERGVGTQAGIFVGIGSNDYLQRVIGGRDAADVDAWTGTGNATAFAAGRLAYHLGLQGPAVALDTACSSSLVAAHLACQSLRAGECSLALAAGVNLILDPKVSVYLSRARALAPDGRCKTFDAAADGYARGEGCGVVVLKRLSDALRDGDTIHAVIRGSAINHDGRASGLTVPNGPAQQAVIRQALHSAGVGPEEVGYVEAHGTGTSLGDPIEIGALDAVLGRSRPLVVGTVKTNLGHLEAAAGIAGLIKATLCVERGLIPANQHFHTLNPHIDPAIPLVVPTQTQPWAQGPRIAGVSAFGLSGTNAHLILGEAPALDEAAAAARAARPKVAPAVFHPKRYWLDAPAPAVAPAAPSVSPRGAAFLGERLSLPMLSAVVFQAQHSPASPRWLGEHRLFGRVVTPGAAHVALSLEAARVSRGVTSASVVDLSFSRAMVLADDETRALQLVLDGDSGDVGLRIGSLHDGQALVHATGRLLAEAPADEPAAESLAAIQRRLEHQGPSAPFYAQFDRVGYTLGPAFRWMGETWRRDGEALCRMDVPAGDIGLGDAPLHPGLIDSCFQLLTRCLPAAQVAEVLDGTALFVPVSIERFSWRGGMTGELYAHAVLRSAQVADIWLRDAAGGLRARVQGLKVQRVPRAVFGGGRAQPDDVFQIRWRAALIEDEPQGQAPRRALVFADRHGTGDALAKALRGLGVTVGVVRPGQSFAQTGDEFVVNVKDPAQMTRLLAAAPGAGPLSVISPWGLHDEAAEGVVMALNIARALTKERLTLVTRGATSPNGEAVAVAQSALLGLQRTISLERPGLQCVSIDLDPAWPPSSVAELVDELERASGADQVALRSGGRSVARLVEVKPSPVTQPARFLVGERGALESVTLHPAPRVAPGKGEVEIAVRATGLNFRDVLGALGAYPGDPGPLGGECTGVISAVGEGVTTLKPGDRVVALLASTGCFRTHALSDARFVSRLPDTLSFVEGATVPVAFATAIHGLEQLAGMRRGDRVLIHAASGGVGMAAVQLALAKGAEVFATAGSANKRRVLTELGVPHVFNSRDLGYVTQIRALTGGLGVDLVLNSLGVEHVRESLGLMREGGRFVEIGKADVLDAARVAALGRGIRYVHFDLVTLSQTVPHLIKALLDQTMDRLAKGRLRPLPLRVFELDETVSAFRHMARARHVGKVVVRWPEPPREAPIRGDRAYVVTGGLGALGLHVGGWLVSQGAGQVVLLGRGAPSGEVKAKLDALGGAVIVRRGDVSDPASLSAALNGLSAPIGGVFHCAGVLDDALIADQDEARIRRVLAPKVLGGWNLHTLLRDAPIEHFVLFSSVSSVLGSPGQTAYSAANAWLNGLASWRQSQGLPALSVAWGPWADGGMAEQAGSKGRWSRVGISPIEAARGVELLGALLQETASNVAVLPFDRARMVRGLSLGPVPPLMLELLEAASGGDKRAEERLGLRDELLDCTDAEERFELMVDYLCACLGTVTEADEVDPDAPLSDNDSLVAVEFAALIEAELKVNLPTEQMFRCDTLRDLAELLVERIETRR